VIPDAADGARRAASGEMAPLVYALQFRGFVTPVAANVLEARASAPAGAVVTTIGSDGLAGRVDARDSDEALLVARMIVAGGRLDVQGRLLVGHDNVLWFRSLGSSRLTRTTEPELRQAAAVYEIAGGEGQFAAASGRITSNLLLSDSGDLTDTHLGVLFLTRDPSTRHAPRICEEVAP
jgi:hypothetical protein